MDIIDAMDKPCPIPVIEAKKALGQPEADSVIIKVDNIVAVQNLEKMAKGYGYSFAFDEKSSRAYEVAISRDGKSAPPKSALSSVADIAECAVPSAKRLVVVISRDTMGEGTQELGKILIKGFIYSLTELDNPPAYVIFLTAGVRLTVRGSNTLDDLKKLVEKGTGVLSCGTCLNYFGLTEELEVGSVTDMYGITEKMAAASTVINM